MSLNEARGNRSGYGIIMAMHLTHKTTLMAEMQPSETRSRKGGIRGKKLSTRVDLTPMVDLGFLLITFFIFTTTMIEANALKVIVPSDKPVDVPAETAESKTISLLLGDKNAIYYYHGMADNQGSVTDYSAAGIRAVLQKKIEQVNKLTGTQNETVVLVKPTDKASYQNIVDILDEMLINGIKKYVLMDISPEENSLALAAR